MPDSFPPGKRKPGIFGRGRALCGARSGARHVVERPRTGDGPARAHLLDEPDGVTDLAAVRERFPRVGDLLADAGLECIAEDQRQAETIGRLARIPCPPRTRYPSPLASPASRPKTRDHAVRQLCALSP